ncbi:MAG: hypothetical protein ACRD4K_09335 [Candidatus Acidiferrales bacterium]
MTKSIYITGPLDFDKLLTYPLASRPSKVNVKDFAKPLRPGASVAAFLDSLPRILAAEDLRSVAGAIVRARAARKPILWGLGGHVIKVGLAPVVIDLLRHGFVSGIAMNGAAMVHDFEIALTGGTSEDVDVELAGGKFGMAEETGLFLNEMASGAQRSGIGLGEAAGKLLTNGRLHPKFPDASILINAYLARVPVTVHLAIGTDIPHMHRSADGAALGAATHHDFRLFCGLVKRMHPGGIYLNWGSAVLLPEIFLKAVTVARNLGTPLRPITTANFDFLQHYRPLQNVVKRPTLPLRSAKSAAGKSAGYSLTGHHEILMPLLAAALLEGARSKRGKN